MLGQNWSARKVIARRAMVLLNRHVIKEQLPSAVIPRPTSAFDAVDGSRRRHRGAIEWLVFVTTLIGGAAQDGRYHDRF